MNKVAKDLVHLKKIEDMIDAYKNASEPREVEHYAVLVADKAEWLLDRLLGFMTVSSSLSLNQKDNDEAVLWKMALEAQRAKVNDWR